MSFSAGALKISSVLQSWIFCEFWPVPGLALQLACSMSDMAHVACSSDPVALLLGSSKGSSHQDLTKDSQDNIKDRHNERGALGKRGLLLEQLA